MARIRLSSDMKIHVIFALFLLPHVHGMNSNQNPPEKYPIPSVKTTYVHLLEEPHPPVPSPAKTHLTKGVVMRVPVQKQEEEYPREDHEGKEEERLVIVVPVPGTTAEKEPLSQPHLDVSLESSDHRGAPAQLRQSSKQLSPSSTKNTFYNQQESQTFGGAISSNQGHAYGVQQEVFSPKKENFDSLPQMSLPPGGQEANNAFMKQSEHTDQSFQGHSTNTNSFGSQQTTLQVNNAFTKQRQQTSQPFPGFATNANSFGNLETTQTNEGRYEPQSPFHGGIQQEASQTNLGFGLNNQNQDTYAHKSNAHPFSSNFKSSITANGHPGTSFRKDEFKEPISVTIPQNTRKLANQQHPGTFNSDGFVKRPSQHTTVKNKWVSSSLSVNERVYSNHDTSKGVTSSVKPTTIKQAPEKPDIKYSNSEKVVKKQKSKKIPVLLITIPSTEKPHSISSKITYDAWRPIETPSGTQRQKSPVIIQEQHPQPGAQTHFYQSPSTLNQPLHANDQSSLSQSPQRIYGQASQSGTTYAQTQADTDKKQGLYEVVAPNFNDGQSPQKFHSHFGQTFTEQQVKTGKPQEVYFQPERRIPQLHSFQTSTASLGQEHFKRQRDQTQNQNSFGQPLVPLSRLPTTQSNFGQKPLPNINEQQYRGISSQDSYLQSQPNIPRRPLLDFNSQRPTEIRPPPQPSAFIGQPTTANFNEQHQIGSPGISFPSTQPTFAHQQQLNINLEPPMTGSYEEQAIKATKSNEAFVEQQQQQPDIPQRQANQGTEYIRPPPMSHGELPRKLGTSQENYKQYSQPVGNREPFPTHLPQYNGGAKESYEQPPPRFNQPQSTLENTQGAYDRSAPSGYLRVQTIYREPQSDPTATNQKQQTHLGFSEESADVYDEALVTPDKSQDNVHYRPAENAQQGKIENKGSGDTKSPEKKRNKDGLLLVLVSTKSAKNDKKSDEEYEQINRKDGYDKKEQKAKKGVRGTKQKSHKTDYPSTRRASVTAFTKTNDYQTGYSILY